MSLPTAAPASVGLDSRRLAVADSHVQAGIEHGVYPAAVLLVARQGKIAHHAAFGTLGKITAEANGAETKAPAAQLDTIFDLASVTKPNVATCLLTLVEDGKLSLHQELSDFLPEAKGTPLARLTLRQLATHSAGLPAWKPLYKIEGGKTPILAEILRTPVHHPPGTFYTYSDLGYILLGEVVERVGGMPLDQYAHARLFAPLGMRDTGYLPAVTLHGRIAPTANDPSRPDGLNIGVVHDGNAHALGGVSGHAGLFGTAGDLAIWACAMVGDGEAKGHRVLGLPTLRLARTSQIPPEVGGHSIGWFTPPNGMLPRGDIFGDALFGHTGFTGTMVVCDPALHLAVVLLTNRVMAKEEKAGGISLVRRRVLNAVASAVTK